MRAYSHPTLPLSLLFTNIALAYSHLCLPLALLPGLLKETKAPTPLEEADVEAGVVEFLEVMNTMAVDVVKPCWRSRRQVDVVTGLVAREE